MIDTWISDVGRYREIHIHAATFTVSTCAKIQRQAPGSRLRVQILW